MIDPVTAGAAVSAIGVRPCHDDAEADAAGQIVADAYLADGFAQQDYLTVLLDGRDRSRTATLLVAVDGSDRVVGTVTYAVPGQPYAEVSRPGEAEFRMLGVDPSAQGRGVGATLVQACIDRARADQRSALVLCTEVNMTAAQRLYDRLGFVRDPERDWTPVPNIHLLGYVLELGPKRPGPDGAARP
jgi:ribosomal protein S18 acetylase RimI-like enzyme